MLSTPPFIYTVWMTVIYYEGSLMLFARDVLSTPSKFIELIPSHSWRIDGVLLGWIASQLALLAFVPGAKFHGPPSEHGTRPEYILNGIPCYVISIAAYLIGCFGLKLYSPGWIFDNFGHILTSLQIYAPILVLGLFIKAYLSPSTKDCVPTGNPILDFYWGIELYPTVPFTNLSFKQLINCRHGMMGWQILILSFMLKQWEVEGRVSNSMWISFVIQTVYIFKFFFWENGYFTSIDIMHDKFGYYICWGCCVFIAGTYTLVSFYLVNHPHDYPLACAAAILGLGLFSVWANFDADNQRLKFRAANGKIEIWGRPASYITANYTTTDGKKRQSLLLTSGWWGVARHFNYIWELTLAFCWTAPAGLSHGLPYFYFVFLCILLSDRASRDDDRCSKKYGKDYQKYVEQVPYKMIPFVY